MKKKRTIPGATAARKLLDALSAAEYQGEVKGKLGAIACTLSRPGKLLKLTISAKGRRFGHGCIRPVKIVRYIGAASAQRSINGHLSEVWLQARDAEELARAREAVFDAALAKGVKRLADIRPDGSSLPTDFAEMTLADCAAWKLALAPAPF